MKPRLIVVVLASMLGGCYSLPGPTSDESIAQQEIRLKEVIAQISPPQVDDIKIVRGPYLGSKVVTEDDRKAWLTSKTITLEPNIDKKSGTRRASVPAPELVTMLRDKFGVNITSSLPLDSYQYTGLGVKDVDGETALKLLFSSMGLDYDINNKLKYVTIVPLKRRQWNLSIGNRKTSFVAGGAFQESGSNNSGGSSGNSSGSSQSSSGGSSTLTTATGTTSTSSSSGSQSSNGNSNDQNGNSVQTSESVWKTLDEELKKRLTIMIPRGSASTSLLTPSMATANVPGLAGGPPVPMQSVPQFIPAMANTANSAAKDGARDFYDLVKIGTHSLNPDTGAVTVQAPNWVLDEIGTYLDDVEAAYNTVLAFDGKIMVANTTSDRSEGLDASAFVKWAGGRYGAVLSNPVLGGVQVSFPTTGSLIPSVTSGGQNISQTALGVTSAADGLNVFNGYLSSLGTVNTLQTPRVVTTSGVPMEFEQLEPESYVKYDQVAAAGGTGSAAVGTNNTEIEVPFGTRMRISPRYDSKTGLVRAQVQIYYSVKVGTQPLKQIVSSSNGTSREVAYDKPKQFLFKQTTEILARDNDLVILSQSVADSGSINNSGITGLGDMSSLFGKRSAQNGRKTYFFALRVRVTRRGVGG